MGGQERRMVRKPATKFGHLQKKLGKQRPAASGLPKRPKQKP
jgi:hypothetical protein